MTIWLSKRISIHIKIWEHLFERSEITTWHWSNTNLLEDRPISNYLNSHLRIPEISGHAIWYTDTRSNNHTTPILTRHLYHIRQHTTRISDLHLQQTLVITMIQSMAVLPNNLHQYWGHRGYLATTGIEAITNILRSEILRIWMITMCSRIPWSSTPRKKSSQTGGTKTELRHIGII